MASPSLIGSPIQINAPWTQSNNVGGADTTEPYPSAFTTLAGDLIVAIQGGATGLSGTLTTTDDEANGYTNHTFAAGSSRCDMNIASTSPAAGTPALIWNRSATGNSDEAGGAAFLFRAHGGVGNVSPIANGQSGSIDCGDNSGLIVFCTDWNATAGAHTWAQINGQDPTLTGGVVGDGATWAVAWAYYADVGAAGSKSFALSAPSFGAGRIGAIEILGVPASATLSSPTGSAINSTSANVGATTDTGSGTLYAVVTTSSTAPSATQVKNGQDHTGATAAAAGTQTVSSTGAKTVQVYGLFGSTGYYAHLVQNSGSDSNVVSSSQFTTPGHGFATGTGPRSVSVAGAGPTGAGTAGQFTRSTSTGGGGGPFNDSAADSVAAADSATSTGVFGASAANSAAATDSSSSQAVVAAAGADSAAATDSASSAAVSAAAGADSAAATDSSSSQATIAAAAANTAAATDSASGQAVMAASASDSVAAGDSADCVVIKAVSASDSAAATDSAASAAATNVSAADSVAAGDSATVLVVKQADATDSASATDSATSTGTFAALALEIIVAGDLADADGGAGPPAPPPPITPTVPVGSSRSGAYVPRARRTESITYRDDGEPPELGAADLVRLMDEDEAMLAVLIAFVAQERL